MPEYESRPADSDGCLTTFEGACREQLHRWAQLLLEDILKALEEMEDLSRQLWAAPARRPGESARGATVNDPSLGESHWRHLAAIVKVRERAVLE